MQINLTGFLEKRTPEFMRDLWTMLLSAQSGTGGIPQEVLERKKQEILKKKEEDEKIAKRLREIEDEARKRKEEIQSRVSPRSSLRSFAVSGVSIPHFLSGSKIPRERKGFQPPQSAGGQACRLERGW